VVECRAECSLCLDLDAKRHGVARTRVAVAATCASFSFVRLDASLSACLSAFLPCLVLAAASPTALSWFLAATCRRLSVYPSVFCLSVFPSVFCLSVCLSVCLSDCGHAPQVSYGTALAATFIEGWVFVILAATGVRARVIQLVPRSIMLATSAGIGLFLAFIGLQSQQGLGVTTYNPNTLITLGAGFRVRTQNPKPLHAHHARCGAQSVGWGWRRHRQGE
jgi:xanthine/uracil/vitamin C permease (AzgA family)